MSVVFVACNRNADLIRALKGEGILKDLGNIINDEKTDTLINLYEGKEHWYFEIWRYDQDYECIVPKSVPKDLAIDMVLSKELKSDVEFLKERCEIDYEMCKTECVRDLEICLKYAENEEDKSVCDREFNNCLDRCREEYKECISRIEDTDVYKNWIDANEKLRKNRILFVGCYDGDEVGHPDIDEICVFRY